MTISRNISVLAQGASSSGILAGGYGGLGASVSPTTAGNVLFTADGSVWSSTQKIVRGTSVSASGTSIDFTSIPSWVKRITVMFQGVSTSGTSNTLVRLGAGSIQSSGYLSGLGYTTTTTSGMLNNATGFIVHGANAAEVQSGLFIIASLGSNVWVGSGSFKFSTVAAGFCGGDVTLSGTLDRISITTVNGTDTFDAGSVNILYE